MEYDFKKLCLPCYDELLAFAYKRTRNKAAAEDVVQDAVVRALKAWSRWEPQGDPQIWARAWMFRIVSNTFTNSYHRAKDYDRISVDSVREITAELIQADVTNHPYEKPDTLGDEVREALERINPEWAAVVKLVYLEGVPAPEAAKVLDIAPGTVRSRMARGRLALARILSPFARQRFGFVFGDSLSSAETLSSGDLDTELSGGADEALSDFESSELEQSETYCI